MLCRWAMAAPLLPQLLLGWAFARTLWQRQPMIERFARRIDADLQDDEVRWCRGWTIVWTVFFLLNAATIAALAAWAPVAWWLFYTGVLGYVLMGCLLGSEWLVRKLRFGRRRLP